MKRIIFLILFSMTSLILHAANVAWDVIQDNMSTTSPCIYSPGSGKIDVFFDINIKKFGNDTYLWPTENDLRHGSLAPVQYWNSGAWLEAYAGDLVDASTIFGHHDYWFYEMAKSQPAYASGILKEVELGQSYYLMFAIEDMEDAWAYRLEETTEPPALYYGWAEYMVDENGQFKILQSAIDFDGGPMIVGGGAIPEPGSGLLLLLGGAGLALRRRKATSAQP